VVFIGWLFFSNYELHCTQSVELHKKSVEVNNRVKINCLKQEKVITKQKIQIEYIYKKTMGK